MNSVSMLVMTLMRCRTLSLEDREAVERLIEVLETPYNEYLFCRMFYYVYFLRMLKCFKSLIKLTEKDICLPCNLNPTNLQTHIHHTQTHIHPINLQLKQIYS